MKSIEEMTQGELGAFVQSHLREKGISVVLSGGALVSIYSNGKYVSKDLDLVNVYCVKRRAIHESMKGIGFREEGRYFKHPDSEFIVEFPPGPLAIGAEPVKQIDEIRLSTGILRILSPTDCVKDRLAAYYHWGDEQCLVQAKLVADEHDIDLEEIRRWSEAEGKLQDFEKIRAKLAGLFASSIFVIKST
ncbi:MAG: hypothetical protein QMD04_11915 [Anaerolineales bacterium]|nr:hypothetical protein [Anaerolineales bacterium]